MAAAGGVAVGLVTYGNTSVVTAATKSPIAQEQKLSRAKEEKAAKKKLKKALKACKKEKPKSKARKCATKAHKRYTKTIKALKRKPASKPKGTATTSPPATTGPATTGPATTAPATTAPATTAPATTAPATTGTAGPTTTGTAGPTTTTTSAGPTTTGLTEAKPTQAEVTAGKALYESNCASCHGALGEGKTGLAPAYGPELPRSMTIMGVIEQLTTPVNEVGCKCMSAYPKLSTAEKEEVAAYVTVELTKTVAIGGGPGPNATTTTGGPTTTTGGPTTTGSPTTTTGGPTTTGSPTTTTTTTGPTTTGTTTGPRTETKQELEAFVKASDPIPTTIGSSQVSKGRQIFSSLSCSACHGTPGNPGEYALEDLPRAQTVKGVMEQMLNPEGGMPEFWNASSEIQTKEGLEAIGDYVCVEFSRKCEEAH